MENNFFCSFLIVENGKLKFCYMVFFNDGMNIYLVMNCCMYKVEEFENNLNVSFLFGYEVGGFKEVVEIEGICEVIKNENLCEEVWNDELKVWFDGLNDLNYVILDIIFVCIEYIGKDYEY